MLKLKSFLIYVILFSYIHIYIYIGVQALGRSSTCWVFPTSFIGFVGFDGQYLINFHFLNRGDRSKGNLKKHRKHVFKFRKSSQEIQ